MKNICLIIEYIGTNYCGFQRQRNGISIQQVLEEAIFKAINQKVNTVASGRTDAGVHALNQVVNFSCSCNIPSDKIHYHINQYLPKDIRIKKSFEVDENFNSRKSAISKTYFYKIYNGKNFSVFDEDRSLFFPYKLDFYLLNKGATLVKGQHNFSAFVCSNSTSKSFVRTIYSCHFKREGDYIFFEITGNGFLYNMVRILVGTLLEVGVKKRTIEDFKNLLNGADRKLAGKTVSAGGLYLKQVQYDTKGNLI